MKFNTIFLHLPKNGGTTFYSIINKQYKSETKFTIQVINNIRLNTDDFINMPWAKRRKIRLVQGHMLFGLHQHLYGNSKYITFLRDPLERVVSFYNYVLSQPQHRLYKEITENNLSLREFVARNNQGDLNNAQIRWIAGMEAKEELMLERALENIEFYFPIVGILEQFNKSLILMKKHFQWDWPTYEILNRTLKKQDLDQETIDTIKTFNQGDYKLYDIMEKRLQEQISGFGFDAFEKELKTFEVLLTSSDKNEDSSAVIKM